MRLKAGALANFANADDDGADEAMLPVPIRFDEIQDPTADEISGAERADEDDEVADVIAAERADDEENLVRTDEISDEIADAEEEEEEEEDNADDDDIVDEVADEVMRPDNLAVTGSHGEGGLESPQLSEVSLLSSSLDEAAARRRRRRRKKCRSIKPKHHYPLPSTTYTKGLPSPLVPHPSGMTMCEVKKLQKDCVRELNRYRSGKVPFTDGRLPNHGRLPDYKITAKNFSRCINEKAASDLLYAKHRGGPRCGHPTITLKCNLGGIHGGENSCCTRKCNDYFSCKETLFSCFRGMYDEGRIVLDTGEADFWKVGHYLNMIGSGAYVGCGFGFDNQGHMVATQQFLGRAF